MQQLFLYTESNQLILKYSEPQENERFQRILNVLYKDCKSRTQDEIRYLISFLIEKYSYFKNLQRKLIEESKFEKLICQSKIESFSKGASIETEGCQSTRLGIILKGKIRINGSNSNKKTQYHREKMILKQGDRTGCDSMLLGKKNVFSLTADSDQVFLITFDKITFTKILAQFEQDRFSHSLDFIKSAQLFKHIIDESVLMMILYNSIRLSFESGEVVYHQDTPCYALYIVNTGKFQISKRINEELESMNSSLIQNQNDQDDCTIQNRRHSITSDVSFSGSTTVKVRVAEPGDVFGEEEIIEKKSRSCSVICVQDSSSVLVIRPILFSSCIFRYEKVQKKLIELASIHIQELKEKEALKRSSYQNFGNRSCRSSLSASVSAQPSPKNGENKTSKFGMEFRQMKLEYEGGSCYKDSSFSSLIPMNKDRAPQVDDEIDDDLQFKSNSQDSLKNFKMVDYSPSNSETFQAQTFSPIILKQSANSVKRHNCQDKTSLRLMSAKLRDHISIDKERKEQDLLEYPSYQDIINCPNEKYENENPDSQMKKKIKKLSFNTFSSSLTSGFHKSFDSIFNSSISPSASYKPSQKCSVLKGEVFNQEVSKILNNSKQQGSHQLRPTFLQEGKNTQDNHDLKDKEVAAFNPNKNKLPITNVNVKLKNYFKQVQLSTTSYSLSKANNFHQSLKPKSAIRPAIMLPHTLPLFKSSNSIYSTYFNLSSIEQLKNSQYLQKKIPVEAKLKLSSPSLKKFYNIYNINRSKICEASTPK